MRRVGGLLVVCASVGCGFKENTAIDAPPIPIDAPVDVPPDGPGRVSAGLIARYNFDEGGGVVVTDSAIPSDPVNLTIMNPANVSWATAGQLDLMMPVQVASPQSVESRINIRCKETNTATIEAWVISGAADQTGTDMGQGAHVVTSSINVAGRNFSLTQLGTNWVAQVRTSNAGVDAQGGPVLMGPVVAGAQTHLVLTVDATSRKLYVNGDLANMDALGGSLGNWLNGYRISFGGEPTTQNSWKGSLLLVAIYDRALTATNVMNNFVLGPNAP